MTELPGNTAVLDRLAQALPATTRDHLQRTAIVARDLATAHGLDAERAELAALLHDIADEYTDSELLSLAEKFGLAVSHTEARVPKLLHGVVGAAILEQEWGITDAELLDAVRQHITGGARMSPLAKVVFLADKLEPERDRYYHGLDSVRELARTDLDAALLKLYAWRMASLVDTNRPIHEHLVAARNMAIERTRAAAYYGSPLADDL